VFAGLIAYAVQKDLEGAAKRPSWQWLFIIEGSIAIGIGLLMAVCLPGFPDRIKKSWMFNNEEIELAISRSEGKHHRWKLRTMLMLILIIQGLNAKGAGFQPKQVRSSLLDPKTWYLAVLAGVNSTLLASTGAFLPTIIKEFGYSSVQAQLFTVIPYACAFVSMVTIGYLSDHFRNKSSFILGCLSLCATGLIILMATTGKQVGVFAACLLVMGAYPSAVLQMAWIQINFCGNTKRAMSWAVAMIFGQGLSMVGAQIYTTPPRFFKGHGILLAFVVVAMCSTVAARATMARANKRRDEELREYEQRGEVHPDQAKSYEETCDYHVAFKYTI
jgi:MFS family permease